MKNHTWLCLQFKVSCPFVLAVLQMSFWWCTGKIIFGIAEEFLTAVPQVATGQDFLVHAANIHVG